MANKRPKDVRLRAFSIKSTDISINSRDILDRLKQKLNNSKAKDRQMVLSSEDPNGELDLLSNFSLSESLVSGTILRIIPSGSDDRISDDLLEAEKFSLDDIKREKNGNSSLYRKHISICLDGDHLVTDLRYPSTIKGIETYINWLLDTYIFELSPVVAPPTNMKLSEIRDITFANLQETISVTAQKAYSLFSIEAIQDAMKYLFIESANIDDIEIDQIMSAKLILQLKKPKSMSDEEYQRKYSALLRPIADLENISLQDKNGKKISSKKLLKEKNMSIEVTESGFLSENQMILEMERFLHEIKND